ncbi:MAG: hypothetical protein ACOYEG_14200 [Petrimonas sp.]|jgi:hypothetical protein
MIGGNLGAAVQMLKVMNQQGGANVTLYTADTTTITTDTTTVTVTEWDDDYLATPSIITETIQRDTFPLGDAENGKLWMYYTGQSGTVRAHGLAVGHLEMLPKLTALTEPGAGE